MKNGLAPTSHSSTLPCRQQQTDEQFLNERLKRTRSLPTWGYRTKSIFSCVNENITFRITRPLVFVLPGNCQNIFSLGAKVFAATIAMHCAWGQHPWMGEGVTETKGLVKPISWFVPILLRAFFKGSEVRQHIS